MAEPRNPDQFVSPAKNLPKPSPSIFNSTGKLLTKHDSMHDRLSLPNFSNTPGTPKSSRSKFILPSSLSPFPFSPRGSKLEVQQQFSAPSKLSSSYHASQTPLRQGFSSEQLFFEMDLCGKLTNSPSRLLFDRSTSPSSSQLKESDMFDICSDCSSELDNYPQENEAHEGSCVVSPEMLKPSIWRNHSFHPLPIEFFETNTNLDYDIEATFNQTEESSDPDYFFANYEIIDSFADGSFSIVFKVRRKLDDTLFAIKRTKHRFSGIADRSRKLREVYHLWLVQDCLHCLVLEQAWEQDGHLYIQTELCENGSLKNVIEYMTASDSKFTESQIWNILRQLSIGLHHIHERGIVHLDIKPSNIFIDSLGILKIGDFGLSIQAGTSHDLDSEGDKVYMAPEVLEGIYENPADIFSLGLIALELAADVVLPGEGEAWAVLRQETPLGLKFDDCSSELVSLIHSMISPNPDTRPTAYMVLQAVSKVYRPA